MNKKDKSIRQPQSHASDAEPREDGMLTEGLTRKHRVKVLKCGHA